ncbi:DUF302 domain-containing protein [Rubrivirga sp. IMCC43871]|uniref:DUF302 domain-containing protein n=1 Tax=Rubrivirga sp. IMCC43871 TaxID=3391575 RepID=UPI00398FDA18
MPIRLLLALALVATGCSTTEEVALPTVPGLAVAESDADVATSFARLIAALDAAEPVGIVAQVDHAANAAMAELSLRPTRVVLFGNPALGTPLMQANPQAGLDLPQNLLVYEDAEGRTVVGYNTTDYLARRHGLESVATLSQIDGALARFALTAAGDDAVIAPTSAVGVVRDQGVVSVASDDDVATVYARLRAAIDGNPNLTIVAELDHQANAASVGMTLPPIRLVVFGNPALGTPLMRTGQTVGIDLPQKMLVYPSASGGSVVAYNDPGYLASRHGLGTPAEVATIRGALDALATAATE